MPPASELDVHWHATVGGAYLITPAENLHDVAFAAKDLHEDWDTATILTNGSRYELSKAVHRLPPCQAEHMGEENRRDGASQTPVIDAGGEPSSGPPFAGGIHPVVLQILLHSQRTQSTAKFSKLKHFLH